MDLQVVDQTAPNLLDRSEGAVIVLVVEGWDPVVRHVRLDAAGRASRGLSAGKVHGEAEAVTTWYTVSLYIYLH